MKKLGFLASLLLLLTACAPQAQWGPEALEHFGLTDADVAGLEEMAQSLNQTARGEAASLRLTQTIGDGKTLYLFYQLTLPEGWGERLQGEETGLSLAYACDFSDTPLNPDPFSSYHPYNSSQSSWSEPEGDKVTGFFSFDFRERYTGRELTFRLGNLALEGPADPERPGEAPPVQETCGDLLSLSWTPTNQAATVTASAPPQGVACTVTPLRLKAEVRPDSAPAMSYDSLGALFQLSLTYADGRSAQRQVLGSGGEDTRGGYSYTLDLQPKPGGLFRPELVETVTVEDVVFRFAPEG